LVSANTSFPLNQYKKKYLILSFTIFDKKCRKWF
jgi:hypothetical protein